MNTAVGVFFILSTIAFLIAFLIYYFRYINYVCPVATPSTCPVATPSTCPVATPSTCPIKNRLGPTFNPSSDQLINDIINFTNIGIDSFKPQICQFVTSMEKSAIADAPVKTVETAQTELKDSSEQVPEAIKLQYIEIGNRIIAATTTGDDIDKNKAAELASKIKQMFCEGI